MSMSKKVFQGFTKSRFYLGRPRIWGSMYRPEIWGYMYRPEILYLRYRDHRTGQTGSWISLSFDRSKDPYILTGTMNPYFLNPLYSDRSMNPYLSISERYISEWSMDPFIMSGPWIPTVVYSLYLGWENESSSLF